VENCILLFKINSLVTFKFVDSLAIRLLADCGKAMPLCLATTYPHELPANSNRFLNNLYLINTANGFHLYPEIGR
jgi:hypothetical protein